MATMGKSYIECWSKMGFDWVLPHLAPVPNPVPVAIYGIVSKTGCSISRKVDARIQDSSRQFIWTWRTPIRQRLVV